MCVALKNIKYKRKEEPQTTFKALQIAFVNNYRTGMGVCGIGFKGTPTLEDAEKTRTSRNCTRRFF